LIKASRVSDSCCVLAKSLGVTTFFWMMEKMSQPALDERRLEHVDRLLPVGM